MLRTVRSKRGHGTGFSENNSTFSDCLNGGPVNINITTTRLFPDYDPKKYYPASVGETIARRYRIISKLGWGANATVWLHLYLVFEPLREPLWLLGKHLGSNGVPPAVLKPFLRLLLQGLDFLHSECHIIHTDLKADKFLLGFEDSDVLENYARQQESNPAPFRDNDSHPVFQSRPDFGPLRKGMGRVQISDFSAPHNHDIQPQPFCAPEVLLKATWTYSADIWNLGTMLWELLADDIFFDGLDSRSGRYSRVKHIAQMIRLLGPPPLQHMLRTLLRPWYNFKFPDIVPSEKYNLSNLTPFVHGEDKRLLLEFVGKMLRWEPADRATARELYNDPWLDFKP
ncbi:serine/threonine protein [Aspergillus oryzae 100-8]|nr:serine/threonine protein [Aspergillus oryzae 100-8]